MKRKALRTSDRGQEIGRLEEIPNVGPAVAGDLRRLGIALPADLMDRDPYEMYDDLCQIIGRRHDPCLLDTFIAAVRYMAGEPKKPWWKYTAERKRETRRTKGDRLFKLRHQSQTRQTLLPPDRLMPLSFFT
jgi:hypothetical protein